MQVYTSDSDTSHAPSATCEKLFPALNQSKIDNLLRYGATLSAFLIPLKLSLTYITLIPTLLFWFFAVGPRNILLQLGAPRSTEFRRAILLPLIFFLVVVLTHAGLGVEPLQSIRPLISLLFFSLALPFFFIYGGQKATFKALLWGQTIAAFHSCIDGAFPNLFSSIGVRNLFIGKVTESGQLSLSCLIACGYIWSSYRSSVTEKDLLPIEWGIGVTLLILSTLAWTLFSFQNEYTLPLSASLGLGAVCLATLFSWIPIGRGRFSAETKIGLTGLAIQLPLLLTALLVNLKRGPLLGVFVSTTIFFLLASPRIARVVVGVGCISLVAITPLRDRLAASIDHFFISGGRSTIWRIGGELAAKFPTGLGFHNSDTLRLYAPEIPPELKHFHSNMLNILAENGWLALALFFWFIFSSIRLCFKDLSNYVKVGLGCALISWQVAGLVEYNFGDSEVLLLVWALLGATFALNAQSRQT